MSDTGFTKRVQLLEHWAPSLLSKLKDLDDLADCILSVWGTAESHTEQRIIKLLEHNYNAIRELYLSAEGDLLTYYGAQLDIFAAAIALIKGEQK